MIFTSILDVCDILRIRGLCTDSSHTYMYYNAIVISIVVLLPTIISNDATLGLPC